MRMRGLLKYGVYSAMPWNKNSFRYFGSDVFFPRGSLIFKMACDQGIYEHKTVALINYLIAPNSVYLDVGANIGLMSIAALASRADCTAVSIEASPATLAHLNHTRAASPHKDRWTVVPKALGAAPGEATFFEGSSQGGAMDGLRDTGRGGRKLGVKVPVDTLDNIWAALGRPNISVIKMDIEGGERDALAGAASCLAALRPAIVLEWNRLNLLPYGVPEHAILEIASRYGYRVFGVPGFAEVRSPVEISLRMLETETFVLVADSAGALPTRGETHEAT